MAMLQESSTVQEPSTLHDPAQAIDPALAAGKAVASGARRPAKAALDPEQLTSFHTNGYLVIRNAFDEATLNRFETAARSHPPVDQVVVGKQYPAAGRWTLARNAMADPDLAFIMATPEMTEPMRAVLDDDPKIIMFAYYDRTPGGAGLPSHSDYKRWRPIGSSMRWAFAIVPLCDFDEAAGKLEFVPGSHRVAHSPDPYAPVWNAERPTPPTEDRFIDPELKRGDLAIVDMHTWHRAGTNNAAHHRTGLFTKWCAATQPPATGWFPFNDEVRRALGPDGEHVLGFGCTDTPGDRADRTDRRGMAVAAHQRAAGQGDAEFDGHDVGDALARIVVVDEMEAPFARGQTRALDHRRSADRDRIERAAPGQGGDQVFDDGEHLAAAVRQALGFGQRAHHLTAAQFM